MKKNGNVPKSPETDRIVVVFRLGREEFGADIQNVREVIRVPHISRVPETGDFIKGVINLRGELVVVTDLSNRFELRSPGQGKTRDERVIVVEILGNKVGILVDEVSEVIRLTPSQMEEPPALISGAKSHAYLQCVGKVNQRMLMILDLNKVFVEDQLTQLGAGPAAGNPMQAA
jgi:purine-binding chemotaxis protein CheW